MVEYIKNIFETTKHEELVGETGASEGTSQSKVAASANQPTTQEYVGLKTSFWSLFSAAAGLILFFSWVGTSTLQETDYKRPNKIQPTPSQTTYSGTHAPAGGN